MNKVRLGNGIENNQVAARFDSLLDWLGRKSLSEDPRPRHGGINHHLYLQISKLRAQKMEAWVQIT